MIVLKRMMQGGKVVTGAGPQGDATICTLNDHAVTSGATAVCAIMTGDKIIVANAGDSRAVLCRSGHAVPLSFDHKPVQDREMRRISQAGGFITEANGHHRVNGNLNLSRSLGDSKYKQNEGLGWAEQILSGEPDILEESINFDTDSFIALACDGVWDVMTNEELVLFVHEKLAQEPKPPLSKICEDVLNFCIASDPKDPRCKGVGTDNMTMVLVELGHYYS